MDFLTQFVAPPNIKFSTPLTIFTGSQDSTSNNVAPFQDPRVHRSNSPTSSSSLSTNASSWYANSNDSASTLVLAEPPHGRVRTETGNSDDVLLSLDQSFRDSERISPVTPLSATSIRDTVPIDWNIVFPSSSSSSTSDDRSTTSLSDELDCQGGTRRSDSISVYSQTSSVDWQAEEHKNAEKFAHLRHEFVTPRKEGSSNAIVVMKEQIPEIEPIIEQPSLKKGDVRTFSPRVKATVVLWEDGTLTSSDGSNNGVGGSSCKSSSVVESNLEQWTVEGILWITRKSEIIFVIDQSIPPHKSLTRPPMKTRRSSSIFNFGRSLSRSRQGTRSPSPGGRSSISRDRSLRPSKSMDHPHPSSTTATSAPSPAGHESSGMRSYLKRLFHSKDSSEEGPSGSISAGPTLVHLSPSRTTTIDKRGSSSPTPHLLTPTQTREESPPPLSSAVVHLDSPFPEINRRRISTLYIASPKLIKNLIHHPGKPIPASQQKQHRLRTSDVLESGSILKYSPGTEEQHISFGTEAIDSGAASLEMDVAPLVKMNRQGSSTPNSRKSQSDEVGHLRECTVTFHFESSHGAGGLFSNDENEAEQFYQHLNKLIQSGK